MPWLVYEEVWLNKVEWVENRNSGGDYYNQSPNGQLNSMNIFMQAVSEYKLTFLSKFGDGW